MEQTSSYSNSQAVNPGITYSGKDAQVLTPTDPDLYDDSVIFTGQLEHHQEKFIQAFGDQERGIIIGPASCGKKVIALDQVAQKKVPALIIVNDESRLREWIELIRSILKISGDVKGSIEEGFYQFGSEITIVISHCVRENADRVSDHIDMVIIDECQRADLEIVLITLVALSPRYRLGLTRDARRKDGLGKTMTESIGPILCHFETTSDDHWRLISGGVLKTRNTGFRYDDPNNYSVMIEHLFLDRKRNNIILQDILHEAALNEGKVLVVSESLAHIKELNRLLIKAHQPTGIMSDTTPQHECDFLIGQFMGRNIRVLLTTFQQLSTPRIFDCQALILASPCPYGFPLMDATAPLLSPDDFSPAVLYDYLDEPAVLKALYERRVKKYERLGISRKISADFVH